MWDDMIFLVLVIISKVFDNTSNEFYYKYLLSYMKYYSKPTAKS